MWRKRILFGTSDLGEVPQTFLSLWKNYSLHIIHGANMSQSTRAIDLISSVRHCVDEDLTDLSRYLMQHSFFTKAVVASRTMVVPARRSYHITWSHPVAWRSAVHVIMMRTVSSPCTHDREAFAANWASWSVSFQSPPVVSLPHTTIISQQVGARISSKYYKSDSLLRLKWEGHHWCYRSC